METKMEATELGRRRRRRRCSCCSDYIVFCEEISSSPPSILGTIFRVRLRFESTTGIQLKGTKELIEDSQEIHRSRDLIQSVIRRSRYQVGPLETKGCGWFNRRNKTLQRVELIEAPNSSASTSTPWERKGRGCSVVGPLSSRVASSSSLESRIRWRHPVQRS